MEEKFCPSQRVEWKRKHFSLYLPDQSLIWGDTRGSHCARPSPLDYTVEWLIIGVDIPSMWISTPFCQRTKSAKVQTKLSRVIREQIYNGVRVRIRKNQASVLISRSDLGAVCSTTGTAALLPSASFPTLEQDGFLSEIGNLFLISSPVPPHTYS